MYLQRPFAMVEVRPPLCLPMPHFDSEKHRGVFMDGVDSQMRGYEELLALDVVWDQARYVLGGQRPFHRNKLTAFEIISPDTYRAGSYGVDDVSTSA